MENSMPEHAFDVSLEAPVFADDARIGRVANVVVDPSHGRATFLVVREDALPNTLRLVSQKHVAASGPDGVRLACSPAKVAAMREYILTEYYSPEFFLHMAAQEHCKLPLVPSSWTVERPATPAGSVALAGHEAVHATDGKVGRLDGVHLEAHTGRVVYLILRQGHLWGAREVAIPAGLVAAYEDGTVRLSVDTATVAALPAL
jgi:sporulation protein YlmC with PRC-barrel domain